MEHPYIEGTAPGVGVSRGAGGREEGAGEEGVEEGAGGLHGGGDPEGGLVADVLRHEAAQEYADAHAGVPRYEDRGVGGAALIVAGHFDKHVEK